jgi:FkbM family methyltransferase
LWPESFIKRGLSPTHCADVLAGSYDVPLEINGPIILDIGANVGAFSKWAAKRWPGARIHCFEPSKANFSMLLETAKEVGGMNCFNSGVIGGAEYKKMLLKNGANNCGECSIYDLGEQKNYGENCEFIPALALIPCDILKLDTEGCEYDILFTLHSVGKLDMAAIVLEWHRAEDRESIMRLLSDSYSITTDRKHSENRGELCFVRKDLLP